uniref:Putative transcription factor GRAS, Scarecrow-like protein 8 n=1 Tax=Helianthus annuus TaxID=4232 RepID=A0A251UED1_HELAN
MSSGFSGGYPDYFNISGRSMSMMNNQHVNYRSGMIRKRSLVEFQQQHMRNVKPRAYGYNNHPNIISSPEVSSVSNFSSSSQQLQTERFSHSYSGKQLQQQPLVNKEVQRRMLRELERELLLDDEEGENDAVSAVTDTNYSETLQKLFNPVCKKPETRIPSTPTTSSSSSCASSSSTVCLKQLISDAAEAITDGKLEIARELTTRLNQYSYARGTPEQRVGCYIASALRARLRVKSTVEEQSSSTIELYKKDHIVSTQLLYDKSPCFKLAFMAANNLIMQTFSGSMSGPVQPEGKFNIHVVDFDVGHALQYVYLIHEIAAARRINNRNGNSNNNSNDFGNGGVERLKVLGDGLKSLANKLGVLFSYNVLEFKLSEISKQGLLVANDDVLVVNFAFKLNKFPDESVSTENLRDALLRRVKGMSPAVVTVAEQDLNTNTASFTARVNDVFGYYTALVDSFDATIGRESVERVKIEEGLSRRIGNSVVCEGRERVERCEVFGKWRARMRMAGFDQKPVSRVTVDSLVLKVNSGTRGNPGFTVKEDLGGVSFGWLGRSLTIVSAWD